MIVNDLIKQFKDNSKDGKDRQAYMNQEIVCKVCGSIKPKVIPKGHSQGSGISFPIVWDTIPKGLG